MWIVVNAHAHGGRGRERWATVAPDLMARWPHEVRITADPAAARAAFAEAAQAGAAVIASAGGDGGVHLLVNALMDPDTDRPRWPIAIGAVGLGSSNDFHKPRAASRDVQGIPVALDASAARLCDLGRADWTTDSGRRGAAYFLLNSSLGAVAEGNARYNAPTGLLAWLKPRHTGLAIQWSALMGIAAYEPVQARIELAEGTAWSGAIANLGVIKRVHFAGDMRYDTPVLPDDGLFDVNLCADMSRAEFAWAALQIQAGRFLGLPKTRHWRAAEVGVVPQQPAVLELDGEVHRITEVRFRVIPRVISVCG